MKPTINDKRTFDRSKYMAKLLSTLPSRVEHTAVLSVRTDIRLLAALDRYYLHRGILLRTKSELIRLALEHYHDLLHQNGIIEKPFDDWTFTDADYHLQLKYGEMQRDGNNRARLDALKIQEAQGIGMHNKEFEFSPGFEEAFEQASKEGEEALRESLRFKPKTKTTEEFIPQQSDTPTGENSLDPDVLAKLPVVDE